MDNIQQKNNQQYFFNCIITDINNTHNIEEKKIKIEILQQIIHNYITQTYNTNFIKNYKIL